MDETSLDDFNLLVTAHKGHENDAITEIFALLADLKDKRLRAGKTGISGLISVSSSSAEVIIQRFKEILAVDPWKIRHIQRAIPVDLCVPTGMETLVEAVKSLRERIEKGQTFRITVEKRHSGLSSREVVDNLAQLINRKVNLTNPDWIVLVEILGKVSGVSLIKPKQILSIVREKRDY